MSVSLLDGGTLKCVSNLVFYAQLTFMVISEQLSNVMGKVFYYSNILSCSDRTDFISYWCLSSTLLYVHRDQTLYLGQGAQDGHLKFHTPPKLWNYWRF